MRLTIKNDHQVDIDIVPIILAALFVAWAFYYYFSTIAQKGGTESVLFIKPLVILLGFIFLFVVKGAVKVKKEAQRREETVQGDRGFLDPRRMFFAVALVAYTIGFTFVGYLIPSILLIFFVCYFSGIRNLWILIGLSCGLPILGVICFQWLLKVPIPVWPWSM